MEFNLRSGAAHLFSKMGVKIEGGPYDGKSPLMVLHEMLSGPDALPSTQLRRKWMEVVDSPGFDIKILSFAMLAAGRHDVIVIDTIQAQHAMDSKARADSEYGGVGAVYEGHAPPTQRWSEREGAARPWAINAPGVVTSYAGMRGLALYEAYENMLAGIVGRENIGRVHWETWIVESSQEVSHPTLENIRRIAAGEEGGAPVGVAEGHRTTYGHGTVYKLLDDGEQAFYIPDSGGVLHYMSPDQYVRYKRDLTAQSKSARKDLDPEQRVVPNGFKITEDHGIPWRDRPEVNKQALDDLIAKYRGEDPLGAAVRPGTSGGGGADTAGAERLSGRDVETSRLAVTAVRDARQAATALREGLHVLIREQEALEVSGAPGSELEAKGKEVSAARVALYDSFESSVVEAPDDPYVSRIAADLLGRQGPRGVEDVHAIAGEKGIDWDHGDFADATEALVGQAHLDDMSPDQLGRVWASIEDGTLMTGDAPRADPVPGPTSIRSTTATRRRCSASGCTCPTSRPSPGATRSPSAEEIPAVCSESMSTTSTPWTWTRRCPATPTTPSSATTRTWTPTRPSSVERSSRTCAIRWWTMGSRPAMRSMS